jgi:hypothetical protein
MEWLDISYGFFHPEQCRLRITQENTLIKELTAYSFQAGSFFCSHRFFFLSDMSTGLYHRNQDLDLTKLT